MEFLIHPLDMVTHKLTWVTKNLLPGDLVSYAFQVRHDGPEGAVMFSKSIPLSAREFKFAGLHRNKYYFLQLEALNKDGTSLLTACTLHKPDATFNRVQATSRPTDPGLSQPQSTECDSHVDDDAPVMEFTIHPMDIVPVKLIWVEQVLPPGRLANYIFSVRKFGPQGDLIVKVSIPLNTKGFTCTGLRRNRYYFLQLDAVDNNGTSILTAAKLYMPDSRLSTTGSSSNHFRGKMYQPPAR